MKQKIHLLTLVCCVSLFCGCSKPETKSVVDIPASVPPSLESIVSIQPSEAEVTVPQETVATDETDTPNTTEATVVQTEADATIPKNDPIESQTVVTQPQVTEPSETEEATAPPTTEQPVTTPPVTEPPVTIPPATEPEVIEPDPTETEESEPTEAPVEVIDTTALEAYGRSYASGAYGYNGTSACHPGTGAGYFPAATKKITSMEEGYSIVRQAIDSQYNRDCAYGYTPYEEIDGQVVRCPVNVSVSSVGDNTYSITVYYGGTA